jgi:hypothetical protein
LVSNKHGIHQPFLDDDDHNVTPTSHDRPGSSHFINITFL